MICCVIEQERNDHLVMMHTCIACGDDWCKKQFPGLPQSARSVAEEEDKEDEEKDDDE